MINVWKAETSTGVEKGLVSVLYDTSIIYYAKTRKRTNKKKTYPADTISPSICYRSETKSEKKYKIKN